MPGNRSRQVSVGTFPTAEAAQRAHDRAYFAAFGRMGAVQGLNVNFAVPVGGDMGPLGEAELRMVLDSIKDEAAAMRIRGKGRRNGRSSPADDDARCPLTSAPRRPSAGRAVPLALRGRQPGPSGKTQATWETTAAEMDVNYKEKITMQRLKDMESLECEMRGGSFLRGFCPYLVPYNSMSPAMAELHRDPKLEGWQFLSRCMSRQNVRVKVTPLPLSPSSSLPLPCYPLPSSHPLH